MAPSTPLEMERSSRINGSTTWSISNTYDNTFNTPVTIGADGSYYDGSIYTYLAGANGKALMQIGSNQQFSLIIGVHAPSYTAILHGVDQSASGLPTQPITRRSQTLTLPVSW